MRVKHISSLERRAPPHREATNAPRRGATASSGPVTFEGSHGVAQPPPAVVSSAAPRMPVGPTAVASAYTAAVNKVANELKNGVTEEQRVTALAKLCKLASTSPREVREALRFKFAKPKHSLAAYESELARTLGADGARQVMAGMRQVADELKAAGKSRLALISATFAGGGVAEMFQTQAHILQQLGIEVEWQKTWTTDDVNKRISRYGETCRKAFDAFQGGSIVIPPDDRSAWIDHNLRLAEIYQGIARDPEVGAIFIEDHHAIDMIGTFKEVNPDMRIVWRSHVDMAGVLDRKPSAMNVWQTAMLPNLRKLGANDVVLFQPGSVPPEAHDLRCSVFAAPPGIDPLAPKNQPIGWDEAVEILARVAPDVDPTRAHLVTGGRFVPWKGLIPLTRAYLSLAKEFPDVDLFVFGTTDNSDPRKIQYNEQLGALLAEVEAQDPELFARIKIVRNKNEELKAFYALAAHSQLPFCQLSLREGYGLMVDEASRQGAVPSATFQGGLGRFKEAQAIAPFCIDIAQQASQIVEPTKMYIIDGNALTPTPKAIAVESALAAGLRRIFLARRDDPDYAERYAAAARQAQTMTINDSLVTMSHRYMAAAAATGPRLRAISAAGVDAPTGAAPMGRIVRKATLPATSAGVVG